MPESSTNQDALEVLLELLPSKGTSQTSGQQIDWDLDGDGLLDPWSVMLLPVSSWPKELRPFAELLRP